MLYGIRRLALYDDRRDSILRKMRNDAQKHVLVKLIGLVTDKEDCVHQSSTNLEIDCDVGDEGPDLNFEGLDGSGDDDGTDLNFEGLDGTDLNLTDRKAHDVFTIESSQECMGPSSSTGPPASSSAQKILSPSRPRLCPGPR